VQAAAPEEQGAAFLVGKISAIEPAPDNHNRYVIRFSEFADLDRQPVIWPGHRNPVWYNNIRTFGIDPEDLDWQPMPIEAVGPSEIGAVEAEAPEGLTFVGTQLNVICRFSSALFLQPWLPFSADLGRAGHVTETPRA
jgi:hypothetical protein